VLIVAWINWLICYTQHKWHSALTLSIDTQHRHSALTLSIDTQHRHSAYVYCGPLCSLSSCWRSLCWGSWSQCFTILVKNRLGWWCSPIWLSFYTKETFYRPKVEFNWLNFSMFWSSGFNYFNYFITNC
jgi:hypothetical protein